MNCCRKLRPATDKYTTLRVEMSTTEIMEDIFPYFKTETTTKNFWIVLYDTFQVKFILY